MRTRLDRHYRFGGLAMPRKTEQQLEIPHARRECGGVGWVLGPCRRPTAAKNQAKRMLPFTLP
jgi:hypothetical protein